MLKHYPKIAQEHENEKDRGLPALICDHLIDVKFLSPMAHVDGKTTRTEAAPERPTNDIENSVATNDAFNRRSTESASSQFSPP